MGRAYGDPGAGPNGRPGAYPDLVRLEFEGTVFTWRGPAPYFFVAVPDDESAAIAEVASALTYGWGVIPVAVRIGRTRWTTSLFPRDGRYLVPLKVAVRRAETLDEGDPVSVLLDLAG